MERERAKTNITTVMKVETDIITCITVSLLILRISVSEVRGKIYKLPIIIKKLMDKLPIIIKKLNENNLSDSLHILEHNCYFIVVS
jgi:hypothetical protein